MAKWIKGKVKVDGDASKKVYAGQYLEVKKNKGISFVNFLIVLCLTMSIIITIYVLVEYHRLDALIGAGEIGTLLGLWGGELLLIVVRQVLGSNAFKKK